MTNAKPNQVGAWWSDNPMTYGAVHGKAVYEGQDVAFGSKEFFERVDAEFYAWTREFHINRPFDKIYPFDAYQGRSVFEIGCGMGTMAMLWAKSGAQVTAVDLSPKSIEMTRRRFELFNLQGDIQPADARQLPFADGSFDYGYSWGVLHHSPDLKRSLAEMMRVLKPGAGFGIMLYCRESLFYLYRMGYREGFLHYENRFLGPLELASRYTDDAEQEGNPHTWPITKAEVRGYLEPFASTVNIRHLGPELDGLFSQLLPGIGKRIPVWLLKPWARRLGWSAWITGVRR